MGLMIIHIYLDAIPYASVGSAPRDTKLTTVMLLDSRFRTFLAFPHCCSQTVDAAEFVRNLPHSIEAVFYLREDCSDAISGAKCEDYGRAAHRRILERFGLTAEQLPLLRLDPWRRDGGRPFSKDEP